MRINLENYNIHSRIYSGNTLLITFLNSMDVHDRFVVELTEVVGFIDQPDKDTLKGLRIDKGGGLYPHDLSLRLRRPEINGFPQLFFFIDKEEVHFSFRTCAKMIQCRKWTEKDIWLK